jgi:pyruvate dehydrogenase E2 component (dihydrolipoamide acetyltransferase)
LAKICGKKLSLASLCLTDDKNSLEGEDNVTSPDQQDVPKMAIELKMPALSPTMEEGTLAKWLVKEGDTVSSGDILAEIETDKATMEFEAVDEGVVSQILIAEGTDGVKVGQIIAMITSDDEPVAKAKPTPVAPVAEAVKASIVQAPVASITQPVPRVSNGARIIASPLAKKIAGERGVDLSAVMGTGPNGRIIRADVDAAPVGGASVAALGRTAISPLAKRIASENGVDVSQIAGTGPGGRIVKADVLGSSEKAAQVSAPVTPTAKTTDDQTIPHEVVKLSNMRKTIARRLTQSMQEAPHIYLGVDIRLDPLLKLRAELNDALSGRGVKLSVNDMLIKALALSLIQVPKCNVSFAGDSMLQYGRADISVAVSIPGGLITPIVADAAGKSLATIATQMNDLAARAKEGKLQLHEYQGGTASISNMGMMGIKQFTAVINPPQAMIMAIGAGEKRPYVVGDALEIATVMTATGSFDHRAIDGADGAQLMAAFKGLVEKPLGLVA